MPNVISETAAKSGPQFIGSVASGEISASMAASAATYRTIRKDPTIGFARAVRVAMAVAGAWTIEADDEVDDERIKFISDWFLNQRNTIYQFAMRGNIDFGWAPFEKVFGQVEDGKVAIVKFKPLFHDITTILVDKTTGGFAGFKQQTDKVITIPLEQALNIPFRLEGTQWYGEPLLENARLVYNEWKEASASANRYDRKVAGTHFIIYYPPGQSDLEGTETDNGEIARTLATELEASGTLYLPNTFLEVLEGLNKERPGWKIELLSAANSGATQFIERLTYLDIQKVRALLLPERAILEGEHGTKAEAGEHIGIAIMVLQQEDVWITEFVNWHCVDQVLELNYGPEARGTVRLVAAPLEDDRLKFLESVYLAILKNATGFANEFIQIDTDALKDKIDVPKSGEIADAGSELKIVADQQIDNVTE